MMTNDDSNTQLKHLSALIHAKKENEFREAYPNFSVNLSDEQKWKLAERLISSGSRELLKFAFLNNFNADLRDSGSLRHLVHMAIEKNQINMIDDILLFSSKVNAQDTEGKTPLHHACINGQMDAVEKLLSSGASMEICDSCGFDCFATAILHGNYFATLVCLKFEADPNRLIQDMMTPLALACQQGYLEIANLLIEYKARVPKHEINVKNDFTLMHYAAVGDEPALIELLLQHEVCPNDYQNPDRETPMHWAVANNSFRAFRALLDLCLKEDLEFDIRNSNGHSPLYLCCIKGNMKMIEYMKYRQQVDLSIQDNNADSALHWVVSYGDLALVRYILNLGANIHMQNNSGNTPFVTACMKGRRDIAKFLLERNSFINHKNLKGLTALHVAIIKEDVEVIQFLIENNADINATDKTGLTPLHYCVALNKIEPFKRIHQWFKFPLNEVMMNGSMISSFELAVKHGCVEILWYCIRNGLNIHQVFAENNNALGLACIYGNPDSISFLIQNGVDLKHENAYQKTPVMLAEEYGNLRCLEGFI